jgi:type II secretory ATPase GspE/PulE/Tfp pilus assembly ATPase PilB-like protein
MPTCLQVRFGFHSVLQRLVSLPKEITENLTNVMKTKAMLNAFEKKKPQEGRFTWTIGTTAHDFRVNTIPGMMGERIALKILYKSARVTSLAEVGFSPQNYLKVNRLVHHASGLILMTGPSVSGKSMTAYASISEIYSPEKNIITVEDPIEYTLDFATQVHASSGETGFTFAEALRSILRQNPNVIMVGEIRTGETGIVAAEAALSGSLVISTMLAGSAISAILRITSIGVPPFWLGSTLAGIVYQQLVRRICGSCKEEYAPTADELTNAGFESHRPEKLFRGKGCSHCNGTGYVGRLAVHEVLETNDTIRDLIFQQASSIKIKEAAMAGGFIPVREDAAQRVIDGDTTLSEYTRIVS